MFKAGSQARFWLLVFALFAIAVWLLKPILLPFVAGTAIAYFLNPAVDTLTRRKFPRWLATLTVLAGFILVIAAILLLIVPLLHDQIGALVNAIPGYVDRFRANVMPRVEDWLARFTPEDVQKIRDAAGQYAGNAAGFAGKALQDIVTGSIAVIDVIALLVITPVVAFYLMKDWPKLTAAVDSIIPRRHYDTISDELAAIDTTLSGFIRGQALVCLALGTIYSIGLTAVGLQYGAVIGVMAGVLTFVPYVGTAFGWIISVILACVQFDSVGRIGMVVAVFLVGHWLEAYVLTPKLVGHRVGLHPVWIFFAIISGAHLMGFAGVLIAVPVAAVVGVLVRFGVRQYKESALYKEPRAPRKS